MNVPDQQITNDQISKIQAQYLCCVRIKRIQWEGILTDISWDDQKHLIDSIINLPLLKKYPVQPKYTIRFIRHIIDHLEATNQEAHDCLYEIYCKFQIADEDSDRFSYKHYRVYGYDDIITLKEANNFISGGTTGLSVWGAAFVLSEWALANKSAILGENVLELGSGTGLSGLLVARICEPTCILLTDGNAKVLDCLRENVRNNFNREGGPEKTSIDVIELDWLEIAEGGDNNLSKITHLPSIILASDLTYDNTLFQPLCKTIDRLFTRCRNKCRLIMATPIRNEDTQKEFFHIIDSFGFSVSEEPIYTPTHLYWTVDDDCPIKVYSICRGAI